VTAALPAVVAAQAMARQALLCDFESPTQRECAY